MHRFMYVCVCISVRQLSNCKWFVQIALLSSLYLHFYSLLPNAIYKQFTALFIHKYIYFLAFWLVLVLVTGSKMKWFRHFSFFIFLRFSSLAAFVFSSVCFLHACACRQSQLKCQQFFSWIFTVLTQFCSSCRCLNV